MDDRISLILLPEPEIEREVLVVRRKFLVVVERIVVLEPAAGGLRRKHHIIPEIDLRDYEILIRLILPDHNIAWGRTPSLKHLFLPLCGQFHKPRIICGIWD